MDKNKLYKQLSIIMITAIVTIAITVAIFCAYLGGVSNMHRSVKLALTLKVVEQNYIGEVDMDEATDDAITAIIDAMDDRWSYYMTADELASYELRTQNTYSGIGVTVTVVDEGFLIISVTRDTPAYKADILPEETIVSINGESVAGQATSDLTATIQAFGDENFTLGIKNADGELREVSLSTTAVYTSPVDYEMVTEDIGLITISNFSTGAAEDGITAIEQLIEEGATALIFDVRYNNGGFVHELTELLDYLLPEGDIFVSCDKDGNEEITTSDAEELDMPMAVLFNENSYSAAELFPAQLEEFGKAITVGMPTTGKGRSQVNYYLPDGSAIHISTEVYLTSERRDLSEEGGIVPQYEVEMSDEQNSYLYYDILPKEDDLQLQTAINALNNN